MMARTWRPVRERGVYSTLRPGSLIRPIEQLAITFVTDAASGALQLKNYPTIAPFDSFNGIFL